MADAKTLFIFAAKDLASGTVRKLKGNMAGLGTAAGQASPQMDKFGNAHEKLTKKQKLAIAGFAAASAALGIFVAGIAGAVRELMDIERLNAQTAAALRSTGGAAKVTLADIEDLSEGLERTTTVERQIVQEGANMLLTFTRVRNEVGRGNDVFDQATEAALDLSVALGTDMQSAAMLVGKALNDPVRGMTAMTRAGIQFTDQQKAMIKSLVAAGDQLGAQKIILAELETQFGGSAEAFAGTTAGKVARFQNDVGNMFESIVVGAVKVGDSIASLAVQTGRDFDAIGEALTTDIVTWEGIFGKGVDGVKVETDRMAAETQFNALAAVRAVEEEYVKGGPVIATEAGKIAGMLPSEISKRVQDIRDAGANSVVEFAAGMLEKQNDPRLAIDAMNRANAEALDRGAEIAQLKGWLTGDKLAAGLNDRRPEVRNAAAAARLAITQRLESLGVDSWSWGNKLGTELARGMDASLERVRQASRDMSSATGSAIRIDSEPPDPRSGLRGITRWGGNIAKTLAEGMRGNLGVARRAAGDLSSALVPGMGATAAYAGAGMAGMGAPTAPTTIVIKVGDHELARAMIPALIREQRRQGL